MKITIILLLIAITCIGLNPSLEAKPKKTNKNVNKIIYKTGINSLTYLPSQDIIPSFKDVMPIVPDSVWDEILQIFDTTALLLDLEERINREFSKIEIDCIAKFIDPLLINFDILSDTSYLRNFNKLTCFFNLLDSLYNAFEEDSSQKANKTSNSTSKKTNKKAKRKLDSKLQPTDSLLLQSLTTSQKYFEKGLEEMLSVQKEFLKSLNSMMKYYFETNKDIFKEFLLQEQRRKELEEKLKPHKMLDSTNRKLLQQFEQENKRMLKEFQEQKNKLLKELENLKNQIQKQNKAFYDRLHRGDFFQSKPTKTNENCLNKDLFGKMNNFFHKLLNLRKEYDKKILDELRRRGFIVE